MYYESYQFGSFDGPDNRRQVMELFQKMGDGVPDCVGGMRRQEALKGLIVLSRNGFAQKMVEVPLCTAVEAYFYFVAITGVLGVPIDRAAQLLEEEVRKERWGMIGLREFAR